MVLTAYTEYQVVSTIAEEASFEDTGGFIPVILMQ